MLSVLVASCTVSKTVVSKRADLGKYKYVAIIDDDTYRMPPELIKYQVQLYDAIEQSGLAMVAPYRIEELTTVEQKALLLATFGVLIEKSGDAVVTVNFIDFNTGRPLVSCQGAYDGVLGAEMERAIQRAGQQIARTFK